MSAQSHHPWVRPSPSGNFATDTFTLFSINITSIRPRYSQIPHVLCLSKVPYVFYSQVQGTQCLITLHTLGLVYPHRVVLCTTPHTIANEHVHQTIQPKVLSIWGILPHIGFYLSTMDASYHWPDHCSFITTSLPHNWSTDWWQFKFTLARFGVDYKSTSFKSQKQSIRAWSISCCPYILVAA